MTAHLPTSMCMTTLTTFSPYPRFIVGHEELAYYSSIDTPSDSAYYILTSCLTLPKIPVQQEAVVCRTLCQAAAPVPELNDVGIVQRAFLDCS